MFSSHTWPVFPYQAHGHEILDFGLCFVLTFFERMDPCPLQVLFHQQEPDPFRSVSQDMLGEDDRVAEDPAPVGKGTGGRLGPPW